MSKESIPEPMKENKKWADGPHGLEAGPKGSGVGQDVGQGDQGEASETSGKSGMNPDKGRAWETVHTQ